MPSKRTPLNHSVKERSASARSGVDHAGPKAVLTEEELARHRGSLGDFLGAATAQAKELHRFLAGTGFGVGVMDREGYIVELIGDRPVLEKLSDSGCWPGTCWTEEAIGASAAAIALGRGIAVQVEDEDDYPGRMEMGRTCSAAPIFDDTGGIAAVIFLVGTGSRVYPHTLGMVSTAAKAVETQVGIVRQSGRSAEGGGEMGKAVSALDLGVLTVNRAGVITRANPWAERVLSWMGGLKDRPLTVFLGREADLESLMRPDIGYNDRELFLKGPHRWVHLLHSLKPIIDTFGQVDGLVISFREMDRVLSLVNRFSSGGELFTVDDLIGHSRQARELRTQVSEAAQGDFPVLLLGEPDTGRTLAAQAIHSAGPRRDNPFVSIDCGAIRNKDHLQEIFGQAGAAPWENGPQGRPGRLETAEGGTVFFTGIEYPSPATRNLLLNLIRTNRFRRIGGGRKINPDLRIIIAARPPGERSGSPRALAQELIHLPGLRAITVPSLKERSEDIPPLAQWIIERSHPSAPKSKLRFSSKAQTTLMAHTWPGNLKELERVIRHAVDLSPSSLIRPSHLVGLTPDHPSSLPLDRSGSILADVERQAIEEVLRINRFNISKTARKLGITRATLYNKLKRYDIFPGS